MRKGIRSFLFGQLTRPLFVGMALSRFPLLMLVQLQPQSTDHHHHHSFVTGLVDSKIHGQRKTMFQRAVDLGLPASFVELRHEATHREPPSLVVLRKATQRSLEWLWDNYWADVDDLGDAPALEPDDTASVKSAFRDVLQRFARWSGSGSGSGSAGPPSKKRKRDQEESVAARLVSTCDASSQGARILPAVLLEESLLVDPGRR